MIEALACGTPVIARPCGSVPEILVPGVSGYIASDIDGLVSAARDVGSLSRARCREEFERRFTSERMAANYESVYYEIASNAKQETRRGRTTHSKQGNLNGYSPNGSTDLSN
jgi:glycosyltransferase involved in cell wall biosynthesis